MAPLFPRRVPLFVLNHSGATGPSYSVRAARVVVVRLSVLRHLIVAIVLRSFLLTSSMSFLTLRGMLKRYAYPFATLLVGLIAGYFIGQKSPFPGHPRTRRQPGKPPFHSAPSRSAFRPWLPLPPSMPRAIQ